MLFASHVCLHLLLPPTHLLRTQAFNGIDVSCYGQGTARTVAELLEEVRSVACGVGGRRCPTLRSSGPPGRCVCCWFVLARAACLSRAAGHREWRLPFMLSPPQSRHNQAAEASGWHRSISPVPRMSLHLSERSLPTANYAPSPPPPAQSKNQECTLTARDSAALRTVQVLSLLVTNSRQQVLYEDRQVLPDGRVRVRDLPLSEKLVGSELWRDAVTRAVREELGSILPAADQGRVQVLDATYQRSEEVSASMSYPGLRTKVSSRRLYVWSSVRP